MSPSFLIKKDYQGEEKYACHSFNLELDNVQGMAFDSVVVETSTRQNVLCVFVNAVSEISNS